jgi:hypothetical protein
VYRAQQEERRPPPFRRSFLRVDSPNCRYIHIKNMIKWKEQSSRAQQEERRPPPVQQIGRNEEQQYEFQERSSFFSFTFAFPSLSSMTTGEEEVTSPSFAMNRREHNMKHLYSALLSLPLSVLSLSLLSSIRTLHLYKQERMNTKRTQQEERRPSPLPRLAFPSLFVLID